MRLYKNNFDYSQSSIHVYTDSRFPICSDCYKTLSKLHGNFGQVIIPLKMEGQKQQQQKCLDFMRYYSNEQRGNLV